MWAGLPGRRDVLGGDGAPAVPYGRGDAQQGAQLAGNGGGVGGRARVGDDLLAPVELGGREGPVGPGAEPHSLSVET